MEEVVVLGAGMVGSLLSMVLARRGYRVAVYDKREEIGNRPPRSRRTINMALSERGWRALRNVGIADQVNQIVIPLSGRMIHYPDGRTAVHPYGQEGQAIYSVSREKLNTILVEAARHQYNVQFRFRHKCTGVELEGPQVFLECLDTHQKRTLNPHVLIGADGAFSCVRASMEKHFAGHFNLQRQYIEHGYKELTIPASAGGGWSMPKNLLHVWPRREFMLIALPNLDETFTATLFFPYEGDVSFAAITKKEQVIQLFQTYFQDALPLMPAVADEYFTNQTSSLATISCYPWCYQGKVALIGDASHTILPFYGQGMNTGFEDCMELDALMKDFEGNWETLFDQFQKNRKANTDAIAELAFQNFVEMREKTVGTSYVLRKAIEAHICKNHPDLWTPLYSMVSFSNIPFANALEISRKQEQIMDKLMQLEGIEHRWPSLDYQTLIRSEQQLQN